MKIIDPKHGLNSGGYDYCQSCEKKGNNSYVFMNLNGFLRYIYCDDENCIKSIQYNYIKFLIDTGVVPIKPIFNNEKIVKIKSSDGHTLDEYYIFIHMPLIKVGDIIGIMLLDNIPKFIELKDLFVDNPLLKEELKNINIEYIERDLMETDKEFKEFKKQFEQLLERTLIT